MKQILLVLRKNKTGLGPVPRAGLYKESGIRDNTKEVDRFI